KPAHLDRTHHLMIRAVRDCLVALASLIPALELPIQRTYMFSPLPSAARRRSSLRATSSISRLSSLLRRDGGAASERFRRNLSDLSPLGRASVISEQSPALTNPPLSMPRRAGCPQVGGAGLKGDPISLSRGRGEVPIEGIWAPPTAPPLDRKRENGAERL